MDPCAEPTSITAPDQFQDSYIQSYIINSPPVRFTFEPFVSIPALCDTTYDFEINYDLGLSLITVWDDLTRTFVFDY